MNSKNKKRAKLISSIIGLTFAGVAIGVSTPLLIKKVETHQNEISDDDLINGLNVVPVETSHPDQNYSVSSTSDLGKVQLGTSGSSIVDPVGGVETNDLKVEYTVPNLFTTLKNAITKTNNDYFIDDTFRFNDGINPVITAQGGRIWSGIRIQKDNNTAVHIDAFNKTMSILKGNDAFGITKAPHIRTGVYRDSLKTFISNPNDSTRFWYEVVIPTQGFNTEVTEKFRDAYTNGSYGSTYTTKTYNGVSNIRGIRRYVYGTPNEVDNLIKSKYKSITTTDSWDDPYGRKTEGDKTRVYTPTGDNVIFTKTKNLTAANRDFPSNYNSFGEFVMGVELNNSFKIDTDQVSGLYNHTNNFKEINAIITEIPTTNQNSDFLNFKNQIQKKSILSTFYLPQQAQTFLSEYFINPATRVFSLNNSLTITPSSYKQSELNENSYLPTEDPRTDFNNKDDLSLNFSDLDLTTSFEKITNIDTLTKPVDILIKGRMQWHDGKIYHIRHILQKTLQDIPNIRDERISFGDFKFYDSDGGEVSPDIFRKQEKPEDGSDYLITSIKFNTNLYIGQENKWTLIKPKNNQPLNIVDSIDNTAPTIDYSKDSTFNSITSKYYFNWSDVYGETVQPSVGYLVRDLDKPTDDDIDISQFVDKHPHSENMSYIKRSEEPIYYKNDDIIRNIYDVPMIFKVAGEDSKDNSLSTITLTADELKELRAVITETYNNLKTKPNVNLPKLDYANDNTLTKFEDKKHEFYGLFAFRWYSGDKGDIGILKSLMKSEIFKRVYYQKQELSSVERLSNLSFNFIQDSDIKDYNYYQSDKGDFVLVKRYYDFDLNRGYKELKEPEYNSFVVESVNPNGYFEYVNQDFKIDPQDGIIKSNEVFITRKNIHLMINPHKINTNEEGEKELDNSKENTTFSLSKVVNLNTQSSDLNDLNSQICDTAEKLWETNDDGTYNQESAFGVSKTLDLSNITKQPNWFSEDGRKTYATYLPCTVFTPTNDKLIGDGTTGLGGLTDIETENFNSKLASNGNTPTSNDLLQPFNNGVIYDKKIIKLKVKTETYDQRIGEAKIPIKTPGSAIINEETAFERLYDVSIDTPNANNLRIENFEKYAPNIWIIACDENSGWLTYDIPLYQELTLETYPDSDCGGWYLPSINNWAKRSLPVYRSVLNRWKYKQILSISRDDPSKPKYRNAYKPAKHDRYNIKRTASANISKKSASGAPPTSLIRNRPYGSNLNDARWGLTTSQAQTQLNAWKEDNTYVPTFSSAVIDVSTNTKRDQFNSGITKNTDKIPTNYDTILIPDNTEIKVGYIIPEIKVYFSDTQTSPTSISNGYVVTDVSKKDTNQQISIKRVGDYEFELTDLSFQIDVNDNAGNNSVVEKTTTLTLKELLNKITVKPESSLKVKYLKSGKSITNSDKVDTAAGFHYGYYDVSNLQKTNNSSETVYDLTIYTPRIRTITDTQSTNTSVDIVLDKNYQELGVQDKRLSTNNEILNKKIESLEVYEQETNKLTPTSNANDFKTTFDIGYSGKYIPALVFNTSINKLQSANPISIKKESQEIDFTLDKDNSYARGEGVEVLDDWHGYTHIKVNLPNNNVFNYNVDTINNKDSSIEREVPFKITKISSQQKDENNPDLNKNIKFTSANFKPEDIAQKVVFYYHDTNKLTSGGFKKVDLFDDQSNHHIGKVLKNEYVMDEYGMWLIGIKTKTNEVFWELNYLTNEDFENLNNDRSNNNYGIQNWKASVAFGYGITNIFKKTSFMEDSGSFDENKVNPTNIAETNVNNPRDGRDYIWNVGDGIVSKKISNDNNFDEYIYLTTRTKAKESNQYSNFFQIIPDHPILKSAEYKIVSGDVNTATKVTPTNRGFKNTNSIWKYRTDSDFSKDGLKYTSDKLKVADQADGKPTFFGFTRDYDNLDTTNTNGFTTLDKDGAIFTLNSGSAQVVIRLTYDIFDEQGNPLVVEKTIHWNDPQNFIKTKIEAENDKTPEQLALNKLAYERLLVINNSLTEGGETSLTAQRVKNEELITNYEYDGSDVDTIKIKEGITLLEYQIATKLQTYFNLITTLTNKYIMDNVDNDNKLEGDALTTNILKIVIDQAKSNSIKNLTKRNVYWNNVSTLVNYQDQNQQLLSLQSEASKTNSIKKSATLLSKEEVKKSTLLKKYNTTESIIVEFYNYLNDSTTTDQDVLEWLDKKSTESDPLSSTQISRQSLYGSIITDHPLFSETVGYTSDQNNKIRLLHIKLVKNELNKLYFSFNNNPNGIKYYPNVSSDSNFNLIKGAGVKIEKLKLTLFENIDSFEMITLENFETPEVVDFNAITARLTIVQYANNYSIVDVVNKDVPTLKSELTTLQLEKFQSLAIEKGIDSTGTAQEIKTRLDANFLTETRNYLRDTLKITEVTGTSTKQEMETALYNYNRKNLIKDFIKYAEDLPFTDYHQLKFNTASLTPSLFSPAEQIEKTKQTIISELDQRNGIKDAWNNNVLQTWINQAKQKIADRLQGSFEEAYVINNQASENTILDLVNFQTIAHYKQLTHRVYGYDLDDNFSVVKVFKSSLYSTGWETFAELKANSIKGNSREKIRNWFNRLDIFNVSSNNQGKYMIVFLPANNRGIEDQINENPNLRVAETNFPYLNIVNLGLVPETTLDNDLQVSQNIFLNDAFSNANVRRESTKYTGSTNTAKRTFKVDYVQPKSSSIIRPFYYTGSSVPKVFENVIIAEKDETGDQPHKENVIRVTNSHKISDVFRTSDSDKLLDNDFYINSITTPTSSGKTKIANFLITDLADDTTDNLKLSKNRTLDNGTIVLTKITIRKNYQPLEVKDGKTEQLYWLNPSVENTTTNRDLYQKYFETYKTEFETITKDHPSLLSLIKETDSPFETELKLDTAEKYAKVKALIKLNQFIFRSYNYKRFREYGKYQLITTLFENHNNPVLIPTDVPADPTQQPLNTNILTKEYLTNNPFISQNKNNQPPKVFQHTVINFPESTKAQGEFGSGYPYNNPPANEVTKDENDPNNRYFKGELKGIDQFKTTLIDELKKNSKFVDTTTNNLKETYQEAINKAFDTESSTSLKSFSDNVDVDYINNKTSLTSFGCLYVYSGEECLWSLEDITKTFKRTNVSYQNKITDDQVDRLKIDQDNLLNNQGFLFSNERVVTYTLEYLEARTPEYLLKKDGFLPKLFNIYQSGIHQDKSVDSDDVKKLIEEARKNNELLQYRQSLGYSLNQGSKSILTTLNNNQYDWSTDNKITNISNDFYLNNSTTGVSDWGAKVEISYDLFDSTTNKTRRNVYKTYIEQEESDKNIKDVHIGKVVFKEDIPFNISATTLNNYVNDGKTGEISLNSDKPLSYTKIKSKLLPINVDNAENSNYNDGVELTDDDKVKAFFLTLHLNNNNLARLNVLNENFTQDKITNLEIYLNKVFGTLDTLLYDFDYLNSSKFKNTVEMSIQNPNSYDFINTDGTRKTEYEAPLVKKSVKVIKNISGGGTSFRHWNNTNGFLNFFIPETHLEESVDDSDNYLVKNFNDYFTFVDETNKPNSILDFKIRLNDYVGDNTITYKIYYSEPFESNFKLHWVSEVVSEVDGKKIKWSSSLTENQAKKFLIDNKNEAYKLYVVVQQNNSEVMNFTSLTYNKNNQVENTRIPDSQYYIGDYNFKSLTSKNEITTRKRVGGEPLDNGKKALKLTFRKTADGGIILNPITTPNSQNFLLYQDADYLLKPEQDDIVNLIKGNIKQDLQIMTPNADGITDDTLQREDYREWSQNDALKVINNINDVRNNDYFEITEFKFTGLRGLYTINKNTNKYLFDLTLTSYKDVDKVKYTPVVKLHKVEFPTLGKDGVDVVALSKTNIIADFKEYNKLKEIKETYDLAKKTYDDLEAKPNKTTGEISQTNNAKRILNSTKQLTEAQKTKLNELTTSLGDNVNLIPLEINLLSEFKVVFDNDKGDTKEKDKISDIALIRSLFGGFSANNTYFNFSYTINYKGDKIKVITGNENLPSSETKSYNILTNDRSISLTLTPFKKENDVLTPYSKGVSDNINNQKKTHIGEKVSDFKKLQDSDIKENIDKTKPTFTATELHLTHLTKLTTLPQDSKYKGYYYFETDTTNIKFIIDPKFFDGFDNDQPVYVDSDFLNDKIYKLNTAGADNPEYVLIEPDGLTFQQSTAVSDTGGGNNGGGDGSNPTDPTNGGDGGGTDTKTPTITNKPAVIPGLTDTEAYGLIAGITLLVIFGLGGVATYIKLRKKPQSRKIKTDTPDDLL